MLNHFLAVGGNEIVNSARAYGYATTGDCPTEWLDDPECTTLADAQSNLPYDIANIADAPWYDPDDPDTTGRFLGLYGVDILGLSDSTRQAAVVQRNGDGAVVAGYRHGPREVRVRGWLTAVGMDALEAGMTWLRNVLEPDACGMHGGTCGEADTAFFVDCPPARGTVDEVVDGEDGPEIVPRPQTDAEYAVSVAAYRRFLHSVRCVSGPFVVQEAESNDGVHYGRLVEFTLLSGVPWVYGVPKEIDVPPLVPSVVQDIAYNLAPYPSAELAGAAVVVATNYSTNPSVETNITGWESEANGLLAAAGTLTAAARSTDIAAVGTASAMTQFTATAAGVNGKMYLKQEVALAAPAGSRYSFNEWLTLVAMTGTPVLGVVEVTVSWRDAGGATLRVDSLGTLPASGGPLSAKSLLPPVGATKAVLYATGNVTSWANGNVIRLYADALAVTVP